MFTDEPRLKKDEQNCSSGCNFKLKIAILRKYQYANLSSPFVVRTKTSFLMTIQLEAIKSNKGYT